MQKNKQIYDYDTFMLQAMINMLNLCVKLMKLEADENVVCSDLQFLKWRNCFKDFPRINCAERH